MPLESIAGIQAIEELSRASTAGLSTYFLFGMIFVALSLLVLGIGLVTQKNVRAISLFSLSLGAIIIVFAGIYSKVLEKQPYDIRVAISEDADVVTLCQYYEIISEGRYTVIVRQKENPG